MRHEFVEGSSAATSPKSFRTGTSALYVNFIAIAEKKGSQMRAYHFLPAQWALDDIVKRRIKISEIDQTNDPFE